jgi:hypothetical protein
MKGTAGGRDVKYSAPGNGNPLLPGYFADPTVKKFGDTYYIYATTDGIKLASGEPQVWISKDFVNWYNYEMDIDLPEGLTNCWAPDIVEGKDGRYYYFMGNCQFGCNIYGYVSFSPMGPWDPINNGDPVIPAGTGKKDLPALDAQFLKNADGTMTAFFGTWCTSFGGMGWAQIDPENPGTVHDAGYIPLEQIPLAFEAAYPMKRNNTWFLMYSSGDCRLSSYAVHYAWSEHPLGPYNYGQNNPILSTSSDGTVDGPGHHSVLEENGQYYIIYHRHDNPHSTGGEFRQVCADRLTFTGEHTIEKVTPTHTGIGYLGKNQVPFPNLAFQSKTTASSFYHLVSGPTRYMEQGVDHKYLPQYATDDHNGTIWKASDGSLPQSLIIDLGRKKHIGRIMIQFEYPTFYYQYKIEVSEDSLNWELFSDKTNNRRSGSPVIDDRHAAARYVRITITGTEKPGMYAAIWNVKIYEHLFEIPPYQNEEVCDGPGIPGNGNMLVSFSAEGMETGLLNSAIKNTGSLGGEFTGVGKPLIREIAGVKSVFLDGGSYFILSKKAPESLGWNSPFTASAWVFNPEIGPGECILAWNTRNDMLQASYAAMMYGSGSYGAMAHGDGAVDVPFRELPSPGEWHHFLVTFDGMCEYVYVDGILDDQLPLMLFVKEDHILIGTSGENAENFTGALTNVRLYDRFFSPKEILTLMNETNPRNSGK